MSITDRYLLDQLVDMAAEGDSELTHPKEAHATDELVRVAYEFEEAIEAALHDIAAKYPPMDGATAQDLIDEEGPYLVYMTLVGAGVGICRCVNWARRRKAGTSNCSSLSPFRVLR